MDLRSLIETNNEILGGQPVIMGTRVPVESLFDHLEAGISLDEFLNDFPTVSRDKAVAILNIANKLITSEKAAKFYEASS